MCIQYVETIGQLPDLPDEMRTLAVCQAAIQTKSTIAVRYIQVKHLFDPIVLDEVFAIDYPLSNFPDKAFNISKVEHIERFIGVLERVNDIGQANISSNLKYFFDALYGYLKGNEGWITSSSRRVCDAE